ncbi:MAG TPA: hypothetical protein VK095_08020 [Beutenbergiaceae bacterium]|nr:hypothetical protein [Beutenbergiaceae bacterium]
MSVPDFRPVILGSDLGVYSLARAFHEAYGVTSVVVSNQPRGPILNSAILEPEFVGAGASVEQTVVRLEEIADRHPGTKLMLLANAEHELDLVAENRERLMQRYIVPYAPTPVLDRARDKRVLDEVCGKLGLPVPRGMHIDLADATETDWAPPAHDLKFPVVAKPANSGVYTQLQFPGKRKVYLAQDAAELAQVVQNLVRAGYQDTMMVQELVPGDDTWGRTVTCYLDQEGRMTLMASGQLLLGMHSATMIGNSVSVLTTPQHQAMDQAGQILAELGMRGFVNFDLKVDPRDGRARFFDLNARIGRPNHYLLVAGVNPAVALVEDYLLPGTGRVQRGQRVGVYSYVPKWWLRRYLRSRTLRRQVSRAWRVTKPGPHPLVYRGDANPRRWFYRIASTVNLVRSYARDYPRPTDTGI